MLYPIVKYDHGNPEQAMSVYSLYIATAKSFCAYFLKPYHGHNFKATAYIYSILESLSSSLFKACFVWSIALTVFIQHVFEVGYPLIFHHTRFAMFRVQFDLFDL